MRKQYINKLFELWIFRNTAQNIKQDFLDEDGHGKQHFLLQFHKTVIRNLTRKKVFQMFIDIFLVVMFETTGTARVKQD